MRQIISFEDAAIAKFNAAAVLPVGFSTNLIRESFSARALAI